MKYFAGIDVGSLTADAALIDENGVLLSFTVLPTGHNSQEAGTRAFQAVLSRAGVSENDVAGTLATGYSRARVLEAGEARTEISCHARGAHYFFPGEATIVDIGGQDSKVIRMGNNGRVLDFSMNDKCAAGTGRFLEVMAGALGVELDRMGDLALSSTVELAISSTCTVFAESEVVSLISQGRQPADIALAISRSIAHRTAGLAGRVGVTETVIMTGGVAKNKAVVKLLSEKLDRPIKTPEEPQIIGAIGAALFAREAARRG